MLIKQNNIINDTVNVIDFYKDSFIVKNNTSITSSINLSSVNTNISTYSKNTAIISPLSNFTISSFFGYTISMIIIKVSYTKTTSETPCQTNFKTIEYYINSDISEPYIISTFGIISETMDNIQLYNPSEDYTAYIEYFVTYDTKIDLISILDSDTNFNIACYTDISSDIYLYNGNSGSSMFEIHGFRGGVELYLPFINIKDISSNNENIIDITTDSGTIITLTFINKFNRDQSYSRMLYSLKNKFTVNLRDYLSIDTTPPSIIFDDSKFVVNYISVIDKNMIIRDTVMSVEDYDDNNKLRDGVIDKYNIGISIKDKNTEDILEYIDYVGIFTIEYSIYDSASNFTEIIKEFRTLI